MTNKNTKHMNEQIEKTIKILESYYCGIEFAAPIDEIVDTLVKNGVVTSRRHFQLRLKPSLLDQGRVVGACSSGMFLCCEPSDYGAALSWYETRISAEQRNMGKIIEALVNYQPVNPS